MMHYSVPIIKPGSNVCLSDRGTIYYGIVSHELSENFFYHCKYCRQKGKSEKARENIIWRWLSI